MSKFYCGIGHKWCKFCRKIKKGKTTVCMYCKMGLSFLDKCPRIAEIETVRFSDLVSSVNFDDAFPILSSGGQFRRTLEMGI